MIYFKELDERLREMIKDRISSRQLTASSLARQAGFRQAHISNYLHDHRGLSLERMDRVHAALGLCALDLIQATEIESAFSGGSGDREYESVGVVDGSVLSVAQPNSRSIRERLKFKRTFLKGLRPEAVNPELRR